MFSSSRTASCICIAAGIAVATIISATNAQPAQQGQQARPDIGGMLIAGLNDTEGCLKVVTAQTSAGTNTIMAWFEDKAAAKRWYDSQTHTSVMRMVGAEPGEKEPMANVADNVPVFVMASITMARPGESVIPGPMPISQISIELYTPLDAGAAINGALMPKELLPKNFASIDAGPADAK